REEHVLRWLAGHHTDLDFGVAPLPALEASVSYGAAYLFAVSAGSPRREAAWRFVRFVMGDEGYARYAAVGGVVPVTRSVAARPAYAADPRLRVFFEQAVAPNPAAVPRVDRALGTLGAYLERFCYGHLGLEETLRRAARDVDALLARPAPPVRSARASGGRGGGGRCRAAVSRGIRRASVSGRARPRLAARPSRRGRSC